MPTVFPYGAQIRRSPWVVSREYRTEIIVSRSGREQARALRQTPRKRAEYVAAVQGDCRRDFDRLMVTAQREQLVIADRVRFVTLTAELSSGNTSVTVDLVPAWLIEDAILLLVDGADYALRTVVSVVGTTITFDEIDAIDWPAGTRLHLGLIGYLAASIPAPIISPRGVVEASISFEADPGLEAAEDDGAALATLGGREVFLTRPNRWVPIDLGRVQEAAAAVDYGFGRVRRFFPIEFSTRIWEASYTGCSYDTSDALRQFFDRMKGRRGEFYMPTWTADLVPTAALTSAGTTMVVSGDGLEDAYDGSTVWKALGVRKTDGTWITRTVTDVTGNTGATITVSAAWGQNVSLAQIDMVCWLPMWRFASDILTMAWWRESVAEVRMAFQMLETLAAE